MVGTSTGGEGLEAGRLALGSFDEVLNSLVQHRESVFVREQRNQRLYLGVIDAARRRTGIAELDVEDLHWVSICAARRPAEKVALVAPYVRTRNGLICAHSDASPWYCLEPEFNRQAALMVNKADARRPATR